MMGGWVVDLMLGVVAAVVTRLVAVLIIWIRERHRSARAAEMAGRLPPGSRYVEDDKRMLLEIGPMNSSS
jgi:hypothetical protein